MFQYFFAFILGGLLLGPLIAWLIWPSMPYIGLVGGLVGVGIAMYINHREQGLV